MSIRLRAKPRKLNRKELKDLRKKGLLPAVLYGPGIKNSMALVVRKGDFDRVFNIAGESSVVELEIDGKKESFPVYIHDIQRHPLSGEIIHSDLYRVDLTKKTTVTVPLVFTGTAPAVDDLGGIVQRVHREVTVEGLPTNIPHELEVDLSQLKAIGDQILIKDITLPEGASIIDLEPDDLVASVLEPRTEKELSALDEEVEEKIEEVEQVSKEEEKSGEESEQAKEKTN